MTTIKTDLGYTEESGRRERFEPTGTIASTNVQTAIEETSGDVSALTSIVSLLVSSVAQVVSFNSLGTTGGFLVYVNPSTSSISVRNIAVSVGELVITNAAGTANNPLVGLANSGATAGTYGTRNQNQVITIDRFGRITNAVTTNLYNVSVSSGELAITNLSITSSSQLVGLANSGVTAGTYGSSSNIPILTLDRFGRVNSAGTASAASNGTPYILVYGVTNQTLTSGSSGIVSFGVKEFDSNNSFSTGNFRFTPQTPGKYFAVAQLQISATWAANQAMNVVIVKNTTSVVAESSIPNVGAAALNPIQGASGFVDLNGTTDSLRVEGLSQGTTPVVLGFGPGATNTIFSAWRVGT